jgi:hypothetical protein
MAAKRIMRDIIVIALAWLMAAALVFLVITKMKLLFN